MRSVSTASVLLALLATVYAAPSKLKSPEYLVHSQRAEAIKEAFQVSWDGYYKHAFPHDSLTPLNNAWWDDRCVGRGRERGDKY
jgi:Glycosyl hydrolase family 47.